MEGTSQSALSLAALSSFSAYAKIVHGHRPAAFHERWIDALEDRDRKRILCACPPEHAKTTYMAILYPAWRIARDPNVRIGIICATEQMAIERSLAVQSLVNGVGAQGEMYRYLFPHVATGARWSGPGWTVQRARSDDPNPTVFACGTLSDSLTGKRLDVIIVDDPMTEEIARSEVSRDRLRTWTKRTLLTRLVDGPDAKFVCIMTRWHPEDMAQTLIDTRFEYMNMPALGYWDDPSEPLWPERFGREYLEERRSDMGSALFDCMYLCDPAGLEGTHFRREWFPIVSASEVPALTKIVSGYDLAISESSSADYTVKTTLGLGEDSNIYLLDVWRERKDWAIVRRIVKEHGKRDGISACGIESVSFQILAVHQLRIDDLPFPVIEVRPDRDKVSRAFEWLPEAEGRKIRLVKAAWNDQWLTEVMAFPLGRYDDQVDSFGVAYRLMQHRHRRLVLA